jgi:hypothetical protein
MHPADARVEGEREAPPNRTVVLAVLNQSHYRQASQRMAADMSNAPGLSGLAKIVDRLTANPTRSAPENASMSGDHPCCDRRGRVVAMGVLASPCWLISQTTGWWVCPHRAAYSAGVK